MKKIIFIVLAFMCSYSLHAMEEELKITEHKLKEELKLVKKIYKVKTKRTNSPVSSTKKRTQQKTKTRKWRGLQIEINNLECLVADKRIELTDILPFTEFITKGFKHNVMKTPFDETLVCRRSLIKLKWAIKKSRLEKEDRKKALKSLNKMHAIIRNLYIKCEAFNCSTMSFLSCAKNPHKECGQYEAPQRWPQFTDCGTVLVYPGNLLLIKIDVWIRERVEAGLDTLCPCFGGK